MTPDALVARVARTFHNAHDYGCDCVVDYPCKDGMAAAAVRVVVEACAAVADDVGRQYASLDKGTDYPMAETCGAVACAVNVAFGIRALASEEPR